MGMTDAHVLVTRDIIEAQHDLAQTFYTSLSGREWATASLLLTTNERGHVTGVIQVTDKDGALDIIDTPESLRLPVIRIRLAMRLPDERAFESVTVSIDEEGNTQLTATYDGEQPQWVIPEQTH
jgi:hypothetical protein